MQRVAVITSGIVADVLVFETWPLEPLPIFKADGKTIAGYHPVWEPSPGFTAIPCPDHVEPGWRYVIDQFAEPRSKPVVTIPEVIEDEPIVDVTSMKAHSDDEPSREPTE